MPLCIQVKVPRHSHPGNSGRATFITMEGAVRGMNVDSRTIISLRRKPLSSRNLRRAVDPRLPIARERERRTTQVVARRETVLVIIPPVGARASHPERASRTNLRLVFV